MKHINSKSEFYDLSRRLLLGNRLDQFDYDELVRRATEGTLPSLVGVRHVQTAFTKAGKSFLATPEVAIRYGHSYLDRTALLFDEAAPTDHITIHGEVAATELGLYLRYSHIKCHQRQLWEMDGAVLHVTGLRASAVLQQYMDASSWDCLNDILSCQLDEGFFYPIVEFACFDCSVGVLGWNSLVWEVRTCM